MAASRLESLDWWRAATLTERLTQRRASGNRAVGLPSAELAERRLGRWRARLKFADDDLFAQRLRSDGTDVAGLRSLLGQQSALDSARAGGPPDWLLDLERAYRRGSATARPVAYPEWLRNETLAGFLNLVEPLIAQGARRLRDGVRALAGSRPERWFDPLTIDELLLADVASRLTEMLTRTLVLELNVARLEERLSGATAEERFAQFVQRLKRRDVAWTILREYPVLARQAARCVNSWVSVCLEFVRDLSTDWDSIRTVLADGVDPGPLAAVHAGLGDRHRGGRSVRLVRFASGLEVIYKPRSLRVDTHFQELLTWLNAHGWYPPFRTLKVVERDTHGWVERVLACACESPEELARFYERQGGYLALLYVLGATDFHFENVLATGEHPVLIDLESMLQPVVRDEAVRASTPEPDVGWVHSMEDSVLRVGMLPLRLWARGESAGIDISGLGATPGQAMPFEVPGWLASGTDEMRVTRLTAQLPTGQNRPTLNGAPASPLEHAAALTNAFERMYHLLFQYRSSLLLERGPLACFANDEVRTILRPTRLYAQLLFEGFHPDVLRDGLDRDSLFDALWAAVRRRPYLAQVIPAERDDLERADIPLFTTRPGSRHLWTSKNQCLVDFFEQSGLDAVHARLQRLGDDDLELQRWLVRGALASLQPDDTAAPRVQRPLPPANSPASREELLAAASAIGDQLARLSVRGEYGVSWMGLALVGRRDWSLVPLGVDLYNGQPGVALFLAYLGALTGQERFTRLAQAAVTTLRRQLASVADALVQIGAFQGWGGAVYTLAHLGVLWDAPELLAEADAAVERLPSLIDRDASVDVLSGAAGCLASLLVLHDCAPSARVLAVAVQCGERLLAQARPMRPGLGWWLPTMPSTQPLSGLSHGAAGIAWVLLELAARSAQERFHTAAVAALDYERTLYCPAEQNWLDLRSRDGAPGSDGPVCAKAWCHGAPGIAIARLRSLRHLDNAAMREDIHLALTTTLKQGFGWNHSLCHGDLGNLEPLLLASRTLNQPHWEQSARRLAAAVLQRANETGWRVPVPQGVETPGLMIGLAGIGYELLRLAAPNRVPSVLALESPLRSSARVDRSP